MCNRSVRLNSELCVSERRRLGLTRESLSERAAGAHPLSVATIKRAEQGQPIYVGSAARLADLLGVELLQLVDDRSELSREVNATELPRVRVHRLQGAGTEASATGAAEALALSLTDDLVRRLSSRCFPVVSVLAAAANDGGAGSDAAGVYDLTGSVVRAESALRISVRLTTGREGRVLWANAFTRPLGDIFALQDEVARVVAAHVSSKLLEVEARQRTLLPKELDAWERSLTGRWLFKRYERESNRRAREHLLESLEHIENAASVWFTLALTHQRDLLNQWSPDPGTSLESLVRISEEFDRALPGDAYAHVVAGYRHVYTGNRARASARLEEAIEVDPNIPTAYCLLGQTLAMGGEWELAVEQLELGLSLAEDPDERWPGYMGLALSYFAGEQYHDAVAWAERAAAARAGATFAYCTLASASAWLGDEGAAREARRRVEELGANVAEQTLAPLLRTTEPDIAARYLGGLKRAGFGC